MEPNPETPNDYPDRWTLIRDLFVFQAKLLVDGLRDLLLVPASFVAGIWSLVSSDNGRPGPQFYQLISLGKQSEDHGAICVIYARVTKFAADRYEFVSGGKDGDLRPSNHTNRILT